MWRAAGGSCPIFQNGRVQNYLRVIAVALVVLAAILLWGRRG